MAVIIAAAVIYALIEKALSIIGWLLSVALGFAFGLMRKKW